MNNLEKELQEAILNADADYPGGEITVEEHEAKAAAQVAMKWIEKAIDRSFMTGLPPDLFKKEFLRELAGLTPTEPDTKEHMDCGFPGENLCGMPARECGNAREGKCQPVSEMQ